MLPLKEYIANPSILGMSLLKTCGLWLPDSVYLRLLYRFQMGKRLHLRHPQTFNEKIQWLKLYNRRPEYTHMVDKYAVKNYVASVIGAEYIIPTLGVWDKPEDIEWDTLPTRFVLKTTHGGGSEGVIICKDRDRLDKQSVIDKLNVSLHQDVYLSGREWPYKNVQRRIIAEQYVDPVPGINDLPDYKFFCFDGEVKALFVGTERQKEGEDVKFDFFDADFNHLPFKQGHENAAITPSKPKNFELMKQLAAKLSKGIPQVRVDLYDTDSQVLFGELTFYHFGGVVPFKPEKWDMWFGEMLTLPTKKLK